MHWKARDTVLKDNKIIWSAKRPYITKDKLHSLKLGEEYEYFFQFASDHKDVNHFGKSEASKLVISYQESSGYALSTILLIIIIVLVLVVIIIIALLCYRCQRKRKLEVS
jgi:hypothetical protein